MKHFCIFKRIIIKLTYVYSPPWLSDSPLCVPPWSHFPQDPQTYFPGGSAKESACSVGDLDLIPVLERSPGEWNDNLLQYSSLRNHMDRGAWQATVHGITKSWTQLSNCCCCSVASVVSDSVRPHRQQSTRLPHPWENTGVGCHFLLQCVKVKSESEVIQSCLTQWPHGLQPTRLLCP